MNNRTAVDVVDDAAANIATAKKENILERLNKRHVARHNNLDVKLEQRHKENFQQEGADYFSQHFSQKVKDIESQIQNMNEIDLTKSGGKVTDLNVAHNFADIMRDIQELQKYLTTSTSFLSDYKIKACQSIINDITIACEDTRVRLMPKKKFGFSGRKVTPKTALNPKLSGKNIDVTDNPKNKSPPAVTISNWTLSDRTDEYIILKDDEINAKDITITNLKNCFVELQGHAGSMQISNALDCSFLVGPVARAVFAEQCNNCILCVSCQQLRFHSSSHCQIYLHVTGRAIVEDCHHIKVSKYNYDYEGMNEDFVAAGIDKDDNNYKDVADFNWLSPDMPSPNWQLNDECTTNVNWRNIKADFLKKVRST